MDEPRFVEGERARFLRGTVPGLVLAIDTDDGAVLPHATDDVNVDAWPPAALAGWGLLHRLTMTVVDGPDKAGFLVQGAQRPEEAEELLGWLGDVDAANGAVVLVSAAEQPPTGHLLDLRALYGQPGMYGGFVAAVDMGSSP